MVIQLLPAGGVKLNIDYGANPPSDTTKLWVPLATKPSAVECSPALAFGDEIFATEQGAFSGNLYAEAQQNNIIGTKIYQYCGDFGGLSAQNNVYWYDISTKQTGSFSISPHEAMRQNTSVSVGTKIYSFGGFAAGGSIYTYLDIFDTATGSMSERISLSLDGVTPAVIAMFSTYKDGKIYFGGGQSGSAAYRRNLFSFDVATKTITKEDFNIILYASHSSAIFVGDELYVIGCNTTTSNPNSKVVKINLQSKTAEVFLTLPSNYYSPVVACFDNRHIYVLGGTPTAPSLKIDTVTKTYEQLPNNFSTYSFGAAYGIVGNKVYILGGGPSYDIAPSTNAVRSFTASSPLTNNHLFLQEDYGYDGLWAALKSKDTDFKVKVINAYLGDSNNIAQLTNAYLYDSKDLKWKSLSGESYVADMQNALNILGVN